MPLPVQSQKLEDLNDHKIVAGLGVSGVYGFESWHFLGLKTSLELHIDDRFSIGLFGSFEFHPVDADRCWLFSFVAPRIGMIFNIGDHAYLKPYAVLGLIFIDTLGWYRDDIDTGGVGFAGVGVIACYMFGESFGISADISVNTPLVDFFVLAELQLGVVFAF